MHVRLMELFWQYMMGLENFCGCKCEFNKPRWLPQKVTLKVVWEDVEDLWEQADTGLAGVTDTWLKGCLEVVFMSPGLP